MPPHVPGLCFCRRREGQPGLRSEGEEQKCRLHRAAWWQELPAGEETGVQAHLPCRPTHGCLLCRKTQRAALTHATRSIGHRSALHRHMQRTAYSSTLLFICKKSGTGMTAEGHRHNERAASARPMRSIGWPTKSIGTTNKRHRSPLPLQYFVAHSHLSWPADLYKSREKANFASTYT